MPTPATITRFHFLLPVPVLLSPLTFIPARAMEAYGAALKALGALPAMPRPVKDFHLRLPIWM